MLRKRARAGSLPYLWAFALIIVSAYLVLPYAVPERLADPELARLSILFGRGFIVCLGLPVLLAGLLSRRSRGELDRLERLGKPILFFSAAAYSASMLVLSSFKGRAHHTYADMATHLEILWRAGHGLGLTSALSTEYHHGSHWFAAHFTPIAYLFVIPFRLFPYPETLHLIQTAALVSAVIPIVLYARMRLGKAAGDWVGVVYLCYPTLHYINLYEFEYLRFAIPTLAWAFYAIHKGDLKVYSLAVLASLLVREEVSAVVAMLGLYVTFHLGKRKVGLVTTLASLAYFAVALKIVIPFFRDDNTLVYAANYAHLGASPADIASNVLLHPLRTIRILADPMRLANLAMYLVPLGFLPLLGFVPLLIALPNIGMTFLSQYMTNYSFILYYLAPSIPFLMFAQADGIKILIGRWAEGEDRAAARAVVLPALAACTFLSAVWFGPLPFSLQFWSMKHRVGVFYTTNFHRSNYQRTARTGSRDMVVAAVPKDARVAAEQPFMPHLFDRSELLCFPDDVKRADYIVFDRKVEKRTGCQTTFLDFRNNPDRYYSEIESDVRNWELMMERDGVKLFRRRNIDEWLKGRSHSKR